MRVEMLRLFILFGLSLALSAWENHALSTKLALSGLQDIKVRAEPLEAFLRDAKLGTPQEFFRGLRVNPNTKYPLYLQIFPSPLAGEGQGEGSKLQAADVTLLPDSLSPTGRNFRKLQVGEMVSAHDVFASASDEPDYGIDLYLWEDNGTEFGKNYGFGPQPFGNPALPFATQAPFHMAFWHEWAPLYWVAPQIKRTYPDMRIEQFRRLSKLAFETGHPYWGWRFAGWGVHYVQDLTQPYHARVLPSKNSLLLIIYGILEKLGFHSFKEKLIKEATDEHLALEDKAYKEVLKAFEKKETPVVQALALHPHESGVYSPELLKTQITWQSRLESAETPLPQLMEQFGLSTRAYLRSLGL